MENEEKGILVRLNNQLDQNALLIVFQEVTTS